MLFPLWLLSTLLIPENLGLAVFAYISWVIVFGYYNLAILSQVEISLEDVAEFFANLGLSGTVRNYGLVIFYVNVTVGIGVALGSIAAMETLPIIGLLVVIGYPIFDFSRAVQNRRSPARYALIGLLGLFHSVGALREVSAQSILKSLVGGTEDQLGPQTILSQRSA
jgi:hypothetical protein